MNLHSNNERIRYMKRKNHILLLIIAVVAAIAVSGCMGNDDDTITVTDIDQDEINDDEFENMDEEIEAVLDVCVECHPKPVNTLKGSGGLHSQESCNFCHVQHGYIPTCSDCHGLFHGNILTNCTQCHTDAHAPKVITFSTEVDQYSCSLCHIDEIIVLNVNPTKHSELNCSSCHTKHELIPGCTNCHGPHDDTMTVDDCDNCHQTGHIPTIIVYPATTPKSMCSGCHADAINMIDNSNTKHSELLCSQCHPQHGQIPACSSCHGTPHGPVIIECGTKCHLSGHDVWKRLE